MEQRQTLFSQQCEVQQNGCVLWLGKVDKDGYGRLHIGNKKVRIHRLVLEWSGKIVPADLVVRHTCDTPRCVNPDHLLIGNVLQNVQDCVQRNRRVQMHGVRHGQCKLTEDQVKEIRASVGSSTEVSTTFNISARTVRDIRSHRRWSHLP